MKLLTIGDPNLNEVCKKYNCKLDDIYVIADMPKRMIYKKLGLQNVFYIKDINDIEEYKRVLGEIGMKFDKVIMNPPYDRNLHLKVLEEVVNFVDNDGEVVNLSPIRWLQDPLAKQKKNSDYNRFNDSVYKKIKSINVVEASYAAKLFNAGITFDLGIYKLTNKNNDCKFFKENNIINKVIANLQEVTNLTTVKDASNCFVLITTLDGGHKERGNKSNLEFVRNEKWYGKYYYNSISSNGRTLKENKKMNKMATNGNIDTWKCLTFNTKKEALNFYNSTKTEFFRYIYMIEMVDVNIHPEWLPIMSDYTQPWTNERFYKYFNITEEEQKIIEDTMAQYETN